ncbi:MAG: InlB B-repeat-containing protein [Clostridia bacterium]|nr:InlB B-repeat-containing protein [Clostridia bacterium]
MKRIILITLAVLLLFQNVTFAAKNEVTEYEIVYVTDSETEINPSSVKTSSKSAKIEITKTVPQKDGYEFLGWSRDYGYDAGPEYQAKQKIEISEPTVVLYAVWKRTDAKKLSYKDGDDSLLPTQVVLTEEAVVSETIPQKDGYVFGGWQISKEKTVKPGEKIAVKKDTTLTPIWHKGSLSTPEILVWSNEGGQVLFSAGNLADFDNFSLTVKNLITGEETVYRRRLLAEGLAPGQYKAWIEAEKYGISYKSNTTNFVVQSPEMGDDTPIRLFIDGEEVFFDMPPRLIDGYTFIALRHFCESMGASVRWIDESRCAEIILNGKIARLYEDSNKCIINGKTQYLPAKTRLISSSMFLPLRSVAEILDCEIVWDVGRRVYAYKNEDAAFDRNMFYVKSSGGQYLTANKDLALSDAKTEQGVWLFSAVDKEKSIFEIYNLSDMAAPLEVKRSEAFVGQSVRPWQKSSFDGNLWKITKIQNDEILISPVSARSLYLDIDTMTLTEEEKAVIIENVNILD